MIVQLKKNTHKCVGQLLYNKTKPQELLKP